MSCTDADQGNVARRDCRLRRGAPRTSPGRAHREHDVAAEDSLNAAARAERGNYVGCIAGALTREYESMLANAGFTEVDVTFTHAVADGMHGAIVKARRPAS